MIQTSGQGSSGTCALCLSPEIPFSFSLCRTEVAAKCSSDSGASASSACSVHFLIPFNTTERTEREKERERGRRYPLGCHPPASRPPPRRLLSFSPLDKSPAVEMLCFFRMEGRKEGRRRECGNWDRRPRRVAASALISLQCRRLASWRRGFILERRRTDRRIVSFHRERRGLAKPAEFPLLRNFLRSQGFGYLCLLRQLLLRTLKCSQRTIENSCDFLSCHRENSPRPNMI